MNNRVGIFGGTFDPVHNGHLSIARAFLSSGKIDELWIMPAPDPPHKESGHITGFDQRVKLLELAFKNWKQISITDFENKLERPSYSLKTIRRLKKKFPDRIFLFCLGSDSLEKLDTWYHFEELSEECQFLVAKRPGFNPDRVKSLIMNQCIFVEHSPVNISSTQIREYIRDDKDVSGLIPGKVLEYIKKEKMYS